MMDELVDIRRELNKFIILTFMLKVLMMTIYKFSKKLLQKKTLLIGYIIEYILYPPIYIYTKFSLLPGPNHFQ